MTGTRISGLRALGVIVAVAALAVLAPAAAAETVDVTSEAIGADGAFLIATPVSSPASICLVDTGTNVNPDTSGVIERLALSGDNSDQSPTLHGTLMAMFMGAPPNGYGMVGLWPAAPIVSVRASLDSSDTFTAAGFINGVKRCEAIASTYDIKVIELALSSPDPLADPEAAALADAVDQARTSGITIVAAAGNMNGGALGTPANVPGVLSIGAADASGGLCAFSATGAALLAPGCDLDGADPATGAPQTATQGTSQASAITAAAADALSSYRPDLGPDTIANLLTNSATVTSAGRVLNVAAAFRSAGLAAVVDRGAAAVPGARTSTAPTPSTPMLPHLTTPADRRLVLPRLMVRVHRLRGHRQQLTIIATNRPHGAVLHVRVYLPQRDEFTRRIVQRSSPRGRLTVRVTSWARISARYVDPHRVHPASALATLASGAVRSSRR